MADKVVLAVKDVSVHQGTHKELVAGNEVYSVSSKVLRAGQSVELDSLPPYVRERVESGDYDGLKVVSEGDAVKVAAALESGADLSIIMSLGALEDPSFSDHHVSQRERVANHAELAVAEDGAGDEALPSLEGLDTSGAETRPAEELEEVSQKAQKASAKAADKAASKASSSSGGSEGKSDADK